VVLERRGDLPAREVSEGRGDGRRPRRRPIVPAGPGAGLTASCDDRLTEPPCGVDEQTSGDMAGARTASILASLARHGPAHCWPEQLIEQAEGVLAARSELSVDAAFVFIRSHARTTGAPLTAVATDIIVRRTRL
jgi:hypothetical protein